MEMPSFVIIVRSGAAYPVWSKPKLRFNSQGSSWIVAGVSEFPVANVLAIHRLVY